MHRTLNDDDVYIVHPEKKHITHSIGSKNVHLRFGEKPEGHANFKAYVDRANKKYGDGHVAMRGRNIINQHLFKSLQEETAMDNKHKAPFSYVTELAKSFAPKGPELLSESTHDDGTPKSTGNAFDFKSFIKKKREEEGTDLRNHEKQKTATGAVYKRKEDAVGADTNDTKPEEKRGRGRPAGKYGSYKKRIKEALEAYAIDEERLEELSKGTLGSYTKKAAENIGDLSSDRRSEFIHKGDTPKYQALLDKRSKRRDGVHKAVSRLTREDINN